MKNILYLFIFLIVSLTSCDSLVNEVNPNKIPTTDKTFVLHCYLSPQDSLLVAKVHQLKLLVGNLNQDFSDIIIPDAKVFITEGTRRIELKFSVKDQVYVANAVNFKIEVGKTYQLEATDRKGITHKASTTVPNTTNFEVSKPKIINNRNNFGDQNSRFYSISVDWNAPANSYFKVDLYNIVETKFLDFNQKSQTSRFVEGGYNQQIKKNISDNSTKLTSEVTAYRQNDSPERKLITSYITFLTADENYGKYHESAQSSYRNENPFAEPTLVFSNISDGYGCFGSYNGVKKTISLDEK